MILNAIMLQAKSPAATPRNTLGQPSLPDEKRRRFRGELVRDSYAASRRMAGIVAGVEWHFETTIGHGITKGDRLEVEWSTLAPAGSIFRVLDIVAAKEGTSYDRIALNLNPATSSAS